MVYYMGSKARIADEIITVASAGRSDGTWVEPFVGGGNVICRVKGPRIGNDLNWRMVEMLDALGNKGWLPPETVTEEEFNTIKADPDSYPPELVAFVATALTFGSKWFDTWARNEKTKLGEKDLWGRPRSPFTRWRLQSSPKRGGT